MACNKCSKKYDKCMCRDNALTTLPDYITSGDCDNQESCSETFDAMCICYSGATLDCPGRFTINTEDRLDAVVVTLSNALCTLAQEVEDSEFQLEILDEAVSVESSTISINFVGDGIDAVSDGLGNVTVTVTQAAAGLTEAEGENLDFTGEEPTFFTDTIQLYKETVTALGVSTLRFGSILPGTWTKSRQTGNNASFRQSGSIDIINLDWESNNFYSLNPNDVVGWVTEVNEGTDVVLPPNNAKADVTTNSIKFKLKKVDEFLAVANLEIDVDITTQNFTYAGSVGYLALTVPNSFAAKFGFATDVFDTVLDINHTTALYDLFEIGVGTTPTANRAKFEKYKLGTQKVCHVGRTAGDAYFSDIYEIDEPANLANEYIYLKFIPVVNNKSYKFKCKTSFMFKMNATFAYTLDVEIPGGEVVTNESKFWNYLP